MGSEMCIRDSGEARVVGHTRAFDFVFFVGVQLAVRLQQDEVLVPEILPEVLLQTAIGEAVSEAARKVLRHGHLPCSGCDSFC